MEPRIHPTVVAEDGRAFATHPAAVFAFIVRDDERVLLMRQADAPGWSPVAGAVEAGETLSDAAMRETAEEVGSSVRVRFLGVAHAWTYHYDDAIGQMIDVAYVMSYEGGDVVPGSDMAGSEWRWWPVEDVVNLQIHVPEGAAWLLQRIIAVYREHRREEQG